VCLDRILSVIDINKKAPASGAIADYHFLGFTAKTIENHNKTNLKMNTKK